MRRFFEFLKRDWWMKLAAIGIAALLWLFVIAQENPTRVKEYENIPVTYVGADQLASRGLCLTDDIEDIVSTVKVAVEAQTEVLQYLTSDDITATLDFSDITVEGEYTLNIKAKSRDGNVTSVTPSKVDVSVENLVTRELPLEVQVIGNDAGDLYYGEASVNTDTVTVAGSQSDIERYVRAIVVVDVSEQTESIRESQTITLLADDGTIVTSEDYHGVLPSVIVEMPIYPTIILPVDTDALIAGVSGVAEGYEITGVSLSQSEIRIAGTQDVLDTITGLTLEKVVLDDAVYDSTVQIAITLPEGAVAVIPETITATFQISQIEEERLYESLDIDIKNLASGLNCTINPESVDVTVKGTQEELSDIRQSDIQPFIDLSGVGAGVHTAKIKFEGSADIGATLTPSVATVEVTITEK